MDAPPRDHANDSRYRTPRSGRAGEAGWFEDAVLELLPDLYGAARRMAGSDADAEDLVAEAVAKAWAGVGGLQDRRSFRGWVFRILVNTSASQARARAARPAETPLDEAGDPIGEEAAGFSLFERLHRPFLLWWGDPEKAFLNRLLREDLERAVDALPDAYRVAVLLVDVQGFPYAEAAEALGIPVGTVRSRLARGRSLLQRALWDHAADAGLVAPGAPRTDRAP